jgi:hypothetical protein
MTPGELLSQTPNPDDIYYIRFNKVDVEGLYYPLSIMFEDMKKTMPGRKYEDLQTLFKTAPPDGVQNLRYEFLRERNTVFWNTLVYPDSAITRNHENAESGQAYTHGSYTTEEDAWDAGHELFETWTLDGTEGSVKTYPHSRTEMLRALGIRMIRPRLGC